MDDEGLNARMHAPRIDTTAMQNPQEFFDCLVARCKEQINVMLPCQIVAYDRATHVADLRVLFNWKMADGSVMNGCVLRSITIRRMMAGGFVIDFPIAVGDTGWIFACDRDAYDCKAESKPRLPPTPYCNSYSSGFWFPDQWGSDKKLNIRGITRTADDTPIITEAGRLVIENVNGSQKISIGSADIRVNATDSAVTVTNNRNVTVGVATNVTSPTVNVVSATAVNVTSPKVKIDATTDDDDGEIEMIASLVKVTGAMTVTGNLNAKEVKATSKGVTLGTHTHKYYPAQPAYISTTKVNTDSPNAS